MGKCGNGRNKDRGDWEEVRKRVRIQKFREDRGKVRDGRSSQRQG